MAKGNKPTRGSHTVPDVYLRGFADKDRRLLYYDFHEKEESVPVKTSSQCVEKDIYEFRDANGEIDAQNCIERHLQKYEVLYGKNKRLLEDKVKCLLRTSNERFLSREEIAFWTVFITIQIMRSDWAIKQTFELLKDSDESKRSDEEIRNVALEMCLPIYRQISPNDSLIFTRVLNMFCEMKASVLCSKGREFITSDFPVVTIKLFDDRLLNRTIFPISPHIAVVLLDKGDADYEFENRLLYITDDEMDYINVTLGIKAKRKIFYQSISDELLAKILLCRESEHTQDGKDTFK